MTKIPLKACGRHKSTHLPQRSPLPPLIQEIRAGDGHFASCRTVPVSPPLPHRPCLLFRFFPQKLFCLYYIYLFIFYKKVEKQTETQQTLVPQRFPGVHFFLPRSLFVDEATLADIARPRYNVVQIINTSKGGGKTWQKNLMQSPHRQKAVQRNIQSSSSSRS